MEKEGDAYIKNRLGINVTPSTFALDISTSNTSGFRAINTMASGTYSGSGFWFYQDDGTAMVSGERLGFLFFGGDDGAAGRGIGAKISAYADGTFTDTSYPTEIRFETVPAGNTASDVRLVIDSNGDILIPNDSASLVQGIGSDFKQYYDGDDQYFDISGASPVGGAGTAAFIFKMNDAAGASIFKITDNADSELFAMDSIGNTVFTGGMQFAGVLVAEPVATAAIAAAVGITPDKTLIRIAGDGGAIDITADPQVADGTDGQIIILQGDSDANTVKLDDGTGLQLAGGASITLGQGDIIQLIFDSGDDDWKECFRSNN